MQKRAHERGRTVIDSEFLTEIRNESMLRVARCIHGFGFEELSMEAFDVAKAKMRKLPRKVEVIDEIKAFLAAPTEKNEMIQSKFQRYLAGARRRGEKVVTPEAVEGLTMLWSTGAEERLRRIPIPAIRRMIIQRVEAHARGQGLTVVDVDAYELGVGT